MHSVVLLIYPKGPLPGAISHVPLVSRVSCALADIPLFTMSCGLDLSSDFSPHLERFSFPVDELAELPGPAICCPGKLKFRLVFDGEREGRGCRVFEMDGVRRLFVNLNKPFILNVTFRIPFTPMNLAIRLIPQFVSPQRWYTIYSFTGPKLRGDHLNLCIPINKLRSAACGVKEEEYGVSNSQDNLPLVMESITCRLHCFSSCFGAEDRGRIELVARLEDLTGPEPNVLGMDRIEVRCSATPSRDINRLRNRLLSKNSGFPGSAEGPATTAAVASSISGPIRRSLPLTSTDSSVNSQINTRMPGLTPIVSPAPYVDIDGRRFYLVLTPSLRNYRGLQALRDSAIPRRYAAARAKTRASLEAVYPQFRNEGKWPSVRLTQVPKPDAFTAPPPSTLPSTSGPFERLASFELFFYLTFIHFHPHFVSQIPVFVHLYHFSNTLSVTTARGSTSSLSSSESTSHFLTARALRRRPTNGMVERFHRQIKTPLRAAGDPTNWFDSIPVEPMCIRTKMKSDLNCSAAGFVFDTALRLLPVRGDDEAPDNFVHRLW
nr:unnamed protein product [Spirometra erinaceieuropaei]